MYFNRFVKVKCIFCTFNALEALKSVNHQKSNLKNLFLLFVCFQAILFYIPRWLWKNWEAGKIQALIMDLDLGIISEVEKRQKKKLLLDYLYSNLKNHNFWAYRYFFCELLSLINVIGQFFFNRTYIFPLNYFKICQC